MSDKQKYQVYLRTEQIRRLKAFAKEHDVSVALIVRQAIDAYLKQPEVGLHPKYSQREE